MRDKLLALIIAVLLSACASFVESVPEGYTGQLAKFDDSYTNHSGSTAHFFVLSRIDGQRVMDSGVRTQVTNAGRGFNMTPVMFSRNVPVTEQTFTISGFVQFATDGQALFGDDMLVEGDIRFSPATNETYTVRGELGESQSVVWIEDSSGTLIGDRIAKNLN